MGSQCEIQPPAPLPAKKLVSDILRSLLFVLRNHVGEVAPIVHLGEPGIIEGSLVCPDIVGIEGDALQWMNSNSAIESP